MSLTPPVAGPVQDAWLVIPLFNEATVIAEVVAGALGTFPQIVCVDDASTDGSAVEARRAGAVVVTHPFNLGQGAALQTGISYVLQATDAAYVVTFDADGQHQVQEAAQMVQRARDEDVAIVFGSRFLDKRTKPGFLRRVILWGAVWITNQQTGLRLSDAHNGLRVIRRDAAQSLRLEQNRMAHATEIVLQLARTRLPWVEHPVHILYTDYSRKKGQSLMNSINILIDTIVK
ncbi:glycosyltransferase family 2 protein [Ornithinimicrobium cryptoxanthini]|uniref:glycosyltransferase family 2 protein n=1 Tax=Ornithinimicrobium cryptoxanthini TaxID=2934161 RepID=UPI002118141A|nr:glycosyltransferase family 2 protein [Ornithinimicrobium cryptoxanthini]